MIAFATGNLLDADVDALVNTVNTEGVMGKGVALQFRRAYTSNYEAYRAACARGEVEIGRMFVYDTGRLHRPRWIINFPTKRHWRSKSRIEDIEAGLVDLRDVLTRLDLGDLPIRVVVYPPQAPPAPEEMPDARRRPKLTAARAAVLGLLARFTTPEEGATPLAVQKLVYFLQVAGEPLQLNFARGKYGPYADATRHVVQALEGHYLVGYGDGTGDRTIRLLPQASEEASNRLRDHHETLERFERVAELIDGFESPYGLELLATTHWAAVHEGAGHVDEAIATVRSWSARKERLFTPEHITVAWERLAETGWLESTRVLAPA